MSDVDEPIVRSIGGFRILGTSTSGLIAMLARRRDEGRPTELMFANTNFVVGCHPFAAALHGPETVIVNDGIGLDLASWLFHRRFFPENLNGTDFTPRLLQSLDRPTRVFLFGARSAAVRDTARIWSRLPNVQVVGAVDGYEGAVDVDALLDNVRRTAPDILFVALGDPQQARWIAAQRGRHGVPLVVAVGALFDFVSGGVVRAPAWVRRLRLEWVFRLLQEPRRLIRRYSIDLGRFFLHCRRTARAERRAGAA